MQAFIFAAGLGTRLQPLTLTMPKAMVTIAGRPLIDILVDKLLAMGAGHLIVNVHHFPEQIVSHIRKRNDIPSLAISDESDMLRETGGALRHASVFVRPSEPLLVHNVDIISNLDMTAFLSQYDNARLATLVVSPRTTSRYLLFDDEMRLQGWINETTGETKPKGKSLDLKSLHRYAFAGIHLLNPEILSLMDEWPEKFSIIDFYLAIADSHPVYGYMQADLRLVDVGKYSSLSNAEKEAEEILMCM